MIDHASHVESVVKDELARAASRLGIDKSEVGYSVGGFGNMGLIAVGPGQLAPSAHWSVMLSLRSKLLGQPPVADSVSVPGILPPDETFRTFVSQLLTMLNERREAEFTGIDLQGPIDLTDLGFGKN